MRKASPQQGFIALLTTIFISFSLLIVVTAAGFDGYYSRFGILESEQKEMSADLAESCFHTAALRIAKEHGYIQAAPEEIHVGSATCTIRSVRTGSVFSSDRLIEVSGVLGGAVTNYEIEIDPSAFPAIEIVSWIEVARF